MPPVGVEPMLARSHLDLVANIQHLLQDRPTCHAALESLHILARTAVALAGTPTGTSIISGIIENGVISEGFKR